MHNKKHPAWMPFSMNFSQQNSKTQVSVQSIVPVPNDNITYDSTTVITLYKMGYLVSAHFNISVKQMLAAADFVSIATIPDEYLPKQTVIMNYITQKGTDMLMQISNARKTIELYNNNVEIKNDWVIRQVVTYISAK